MRQVQFMGCVLGFLVMLSGCGSKGPRSLTEFSDEEGGFEVLLPGTPTEQSITTPGMAQKTFAVDDVVGGVVVTYSDVSEDQRQGALDRAVRGMVGNVMGT